MHGIHARLVRHEIFKVVLNGLRYLDHVTFDFALEPQTQGRMMNSYIPHKTITYQSHVRPQLA